MNRAQCGSKFHFHPRTWLGALSALCLLGATPVLTAADWPQWRGPARDGVALEPLPEKLPDSPATVWRKTVGQWVIESELYVTLAG